MKHTCSTTLLTQRVARSLCDSRASCWDIAKYWFIIADVNLPHLYLAPPVRVTPFEFRRDLWGKKTRSPWAIVQCYLRDPTFGRFDAIPACDRWTDTRWRHIYRAIVWRRAVKFLYSIKKRARDISVFTRPHSLSFGLMNIPCKGGRCRCSLRSREDIIYTPRCFVRRLTLIDLAAIPLIAWRRMVHNPVRDVHWLHLATRPSDLTRRDDWHLLVKMTSGMQ